MKEFDNLKTIWEQQNATVIPNVSQIISKAKNKKNSIRNTILFQVFALIMAVIAVITVLCTINFKMATTFIGIAITVLTILIFSGIRIYQANQLNKINLVQSPNIVLQELNTYCTFDKKMRTTGILLYFIFLNIGLGFYFIEVLQPLSMPIKIVSIVIYFGWILFAYFVLGKKQIKKEDEKMNFLIESIENLENEYKN